MTAAGLIFSNIHDQSTPELTRVRTMASVPFGGRYRLIDFALSKQGSVELIVVADGGHKTVALPMKTFTEASVSVMQPTRK